MPKQVSMFGRPRCELCHAEIEWISTAGGKAMPVDPGRVTVVTSGGDTVTGQIPHWATCPRAEEARKR